MNILYDKRTADHLYLFLVMNILLAMTSHHLCYAVSKREGQYSLLTNYEYDNNELT